MCTRRMSRNNVLVHINDISIVSHFMVSLRILILLLLSYVHRVIIKFYWEASNFLCYSWLNRLRNFLWNLYKLFALLLGQSGNMANNAIFLKKRTAGTRRRCETPILSAVKWAMVRYTYHESKRQKLGVMETESYLRFSMVRWW